MTRWIQARVLLSEENYVETGYHAQDVSSIMQTIESWQENQTIVQFQSLNSGYSVTVEDYDFGGLTPNAARDGWNGTMTLRLKRV